MSEPTPTEAEPENPTESEPDQGDKTAPRLKGDLVGGLVTAVVAIPGNVAFGMLAFAPLGQDYVGIAILAGMYASVFGSAIASLLGKTRIMISGPEAPSALLIAGLIAHIVAVRGGAAGMPLGAGALLGICLFTIFLSGLFQILFGALRLGVLIKFISYPVLAGIINGTAVIIIVKQIGPFLGVPGCGFLELFARLNEIQPPALVVSGVTFVLIMSGRRMIPRIPASVLGILGGTALYHMLSFGGLSHGLGGVLGDVPVGFPTFAHFAKFILIPFDPDYMDIMPLIFGTAFTIAVLHSVNSLLALVYLRNLTDEHPDGNRELIGQGIGNVAASCFGGLPADGHIGRSVVNHESGGRTKRSVVFSSLAILLLLVFFGNVIGKIPQAVMAGVVMAIGVMIFDRSVLAMAGKVVRRQVSNISEIMVNIGIVVLVMVVTVAVNLISAVIVGIGVSLIVFISQMSSSVVRRIHYGSNLNSKKQRFQEAAEMLLRHKEEIVVVELQGALFFGSADAMGQQVEDLAEKGARFVVMDLKRLNRIDSTGANILVQTFKQLDKKGCRLCLSYLSEADEKYPVMKDFGVIDAFGKENIFYDTSEAVEAAEDDLLFRRMGRDPGKEAVPIYKILEYNGLSESEIDLLTRYLIQKEYAADDHIVRQGEEGDRMFFLERGNVDVVLSLEGASKTKRLMSIMPGSIFGEMAIVDGARRAADIVACAPAVCYILTQSALDTLKRERPELALKFSTILARIISRRLRVANDIIAELEA